MREAGVDRFGASSKQFIGCRVTIPEWAPHTLQCAQDREYVRVSIIIKNYNYGRFVRQAIESALAIDWRNKEVIVVDDGSTDNSPAVIRSFGDRISPIFVANGGQTKAANLGFERSTGDIVTFLDSDDVLLPTIAREVVAAWRDGIAKVQYGMTYVDERLQPLGRHWPVFSEKHTPELVAKLMGQTGAYLASPTSAFSRAFLKEVFPLPTRDQGLYAIDTYLNTLAPFFGDVVSLRSPQYLYRRHDQNDSGFSGLEQYLDRYPRAINDVEILLQLASELLLRKGRTRSISRSNEYYAKLAFVSKRFFPDRCPDRLRSLLLKYWRSVVDTEWFTSTQKALLFVWSLAVATAPRWVACRLVLIRDRHATAHVKSLGRPLRRAIGRGNS
jgi:glycosyltransferase involved in cell wall biosynthesis